MAKDTLAVSVTLRDPKTHKLVSFAVGDKPPKWAKDTITNPAAWEAKASPKPARGGRSRKAAEAPDTDAQEPADTEAEDQGVADASEPQDGSGDPAEDGDGAQVPEPPRAGKGSGTQAWQDYADLLGIEYDEDASRDDLIALVDAATTEQ